MKTGRAALSSTGKGDRELRDRLPYLACQWRSGEFDDAVFATLYFFYWQISLYGSAFAARRCKYDERPDAVRWLDMFSVAGGQFQRQRLIEHLDRYQFRGVAASVPAVMVQWLRGQWSLTLQEDIPDPMTVLRAQARGSRPVTVITDYPRMFDPVLTKADAFAFFLHDLEHADKFFRTAALHAEQCAFFAKLETMIDRGVFAPYFINPVFVDKFHYLMSDMNTHPEHSRQYLRAILIEFWLHREGKGSRAPLSSSAQMAIDNVMRMFVDSMSMRSDDKGIVSLNLTRYGNPLHEGRISS